MNRLTTISAVTTVAAAIGLALAVQAPVMAQGMMKQGGMKDMASGPAHEKCFGINAVGKNDCRTASVAGPGKATQARDPKAYVDVPAGLCAKIAGGSTTPM